MAVVQGGHKRVQHQRAKIVDQLTLQPAFLRIAEDIEHRAPQKASPREQCQRRIHPPAEPRFARVAGDGVPRSEEHTSELQSLMRNSYAVFCLKKIKIKEAQT